jgi:Pyruvate/2-oxoacid:ferredoxin oxidoreductase delta subunit
MIGEETFDKVQKHLSRKGNSRKNKKELPYKKSIKCGACKRYITLEEKKKKNKIYAHCAGRSQAKKCNEKSIELKELEQTIIQNLSAINIPPALLDWAGQNVLSTTQKTIEDLDLGIERNEDAIKNNNVLLRKLETRWIEGLPNDSYYSRKKEIDDNNLEINRQITESKTEKQQLESLIVDGSDFTATLVRMFQASDWRKKTELLRKLAKPYKQDGLVIQDGVLSMKMREVFA